MNLRWTGEEIQDEVEYPLGGLLPFDEAVRTGVSPHIRHEQAANRDADVKFIALDSQDRILHFDGLSVKPQLPIFPEFDVLH